VKATSPLQNDDAESKACRVIRASRLKT
jgi:hypothetical protein